MANEIQELKFQVGEAWKGVYSPSTAYGLANVVQDPTGLSVYRSLKSGNVGHTVSDRTWWFCIIDMSSIKDESDRIAALNQAIAQDEALRVAAEELRQQHEAERVAAETQRNEAEQQRISAEQARVNAESARATAEQQRITAEQGRVSAESARVQAEQARVLAETLRANAEDQRAANEQNRIAAEQQRIERAEQDHQRAESDHATYVDSLGAFDISSYHATDGVLATYANLSAALGTNGANIPDALRKGGMSVKFVQSSDNKYIQARCTAQNFTTDVTQWQGVDDEPTAGSDNLVKSGGVINNIIQRWNMLGLNPDRTKLNDPSEITANSDTAGFLSCIVDYHLFCKVNPNSQLSLSVASQSAGFMFGFYKITGASWYHGVYLYTSSDPVPTGIVKYEVKDAYFELYVTINWDLYNGKGITGSGTDIKVVADYKLITDPSYKTFTNAYTTIQEVDTKLVADRYVRRLQNKNLILLDNIEIGYINYQTGGNAGSADSPFRRTEYIKVDAGDTYTFSGKDIYCICYYDASKTYIVGYLLNTQVDTRAVPSNAVYARMAFQAVFADTVMYEKSAAPTDYVAGEIAIPEQYVPAEILRKNELGGYIPFQHINLFNPSTVKDNSIIRQSDGAIVSNQDYVVSDFIPIVGDENYTLSYDKPQNVMMQPVAFYTEHWEYISVAVNYVYNRWTFKAPANAAYMRVSVHKAEYDTCFQVEEGDLVSKYVPYNNVYVLPKYVKSSPKSVTVSLDGRGDYNSILAALKETSDDTAVFIKDGEYDIKQEYIDYYNDAEWFDNYEGFSGSDDPFTRGLWLGFGRQIIGESNTTIKFGYDGENTLVARWFSVFANEGNSLLKNLTIIDTNAKSVEYLVHDDFSNNGKGGTIRYENVIFKGHGALIGAGFGMNVTYHIDNCMCIDTVSYNGDGGEQVANISYHGSNSNLADNRCKLFINNCYVTNNIAVVWNGAATVNSEVYVSNCKAYSITCTPHPSAQIGVPNVAMLKFCCDETVVGVNQNPLIPTN